MDFHLDYGLRLHTEPKYKNLYSWAINEVEADGSLIDRDQIPWRWTLYFSATSCTLTNRLEIDPPFSLKGDSEKPPRITANETIHMTLQPGSRRTGGFLDSVKFSMFGTKREIRDFTLEVRPLGNPEETEHCEAWGSVSYTAEHDFRNVTYNDCICFFLSVKPNTFARYVALIDQSSIDNISFSVGSVDGFYSDWSPSISTDRIKVLLESDEHKFVLPPDFQGNTPRLGRVRDARLLLQRRIELDKDSPMPAEDLPPPSNDEEHYTTPSVSSALQTAPAMDPRLLLVLASLKKAMWIAVALLAAIAVATLQRH